MNLVLPGLASYIKGVYDNHFDDNLFILPAQFIDSIDMDNIPIIQLQMDIFRDILTIQVDNLLIFRDVHLEFYVLFDLPHRYLGVQLHLITLWGVGLEIYGYLLVVILGVGV